MRRVSIAQAKQTIKNVTSEDGQIAATAWAANLTPVTADTKHLAPFRDLSVVDWTK